MEKESVSDICKSEFPDKKFTKAHMRSAGIRLRKGRDFCVEYLRSIGEPYDVQPPVICNIVARSRPIEEWPISKDLKTIQKYVFSFTEEKRKSFEKIPQNLEDLQSFLKGTNVDANGDVQAIAKIVKNAFSTYDGVPVKVKNRNNKLSKKIEKENKYRKENGKELLQFVEEKAYDESGHLINPPGINRNIYCIQGHKVRAADIVKDGKEITEHIGNYTKQPNDPIPIGVINRLDIQKGQPGYIPEHQRPFVNPNKKRIHKRYENNSDKMRDAVLGIIRIGKDWILVDLRGILRNAHYRGIISKDTRKEITPDQLLELMTGGPVIDPIKNTVTFRYKPDMVKIESKNVIKGKSSKERIQELGQKGSVAMLTIDFGVKNPIAASISVVGTVNGAPQYPGSITNIDKMFLPENLLKETDDYKKAYDSFKERIKKDAIASLSEEQRNEVVLINNITPESLKKEVCKKFGIDPSLIKWDEMNPFTNFISDYLSQNNRDSDAFFETNDKKTKKPKIVKYKDFDYWKKVCPKLSEETRKVLNETEWKLERESLEYKKFSVRKSQFARTVANCFISETKRITKKDQMIVVLEDLDVIGMHGSGKRDNGWDNFFSYKKENRWFIQPLYKAFCDLGPNKGICLTYSPS